MQNTLGLDLGANSLGWAVIDDESKTIVKSGVVIFPEGIEREKGNDTTRTPAAIRRAYRTARRLKFRRKIRKWKLLEVLIEEKMCPLTKEELLAWKSRGVYPLANKEFLQWLKATDDSNPYCDRAAAASGRVAPFVLGRALYHVCQRRGFKSSRKDAGADTGDEQANQKQSEKATGLVKSGISELSRQIEESGCETLGQYFYKIMESERGGLQKTRIRKRYAGRIEHYAKEFAVIMRAQAIKEDSDLWRKLYQAIFMQRPLRSQRFLVGKCPLEPKQSRTFVGHPDFEEFRMLSFINNLSFEDENGARQPLSQEDRELVRGAFMRASTTFQFKAISKLFKNDQRFKAHGWHFYHYRDEETLSSCSVSHRLAVNFGQIPYDREMVVNALMFFEDLEKLEGWFRRHYPALTDEQVRKLAAIRPNEATSKYSLKAIRKILPYLRQGLQLYDAALWANLPAAMPDYEANKDAVRLAIEEVRYQYQAQKQNVANGTGQRMVPFLDRLYSELHGRFGVTPEAWRRLYVMHDSPYKVEKEGRVPAVQLGMVRNPLVQRALTILRRLVNYLRDNGVIDGDTTIRIELARSVNSYAERKAWTIWQEKLRKRRECAADELVGVYNVKPTEDAVERWILWQEQGKRCLYTGETIGASELFSENTPWDVEHTVPRSRSGDDSYANKTICAAKYNREVKMGRIPTECPNYAEIEVRLRPWRDQVEALQKSFLSQSRIRGNAEARAKALALKHELDYWRDKVRRFSIETEKLADPENGLSGFKKRQLVDTGIMSTKAVELLKSVYPKVYAVNGRATSFARKAWGLQEADEAKNRSDHTHHAKDAMVIAALTPTRFNMICTALKDDAKQYLKECKLCTPPWKGFSEEVRQETARICVRHVFRRNTMKQSTKQTVLAHPHPQKNAPEKIVKYVNARGDTVRGQLHKETFYGCIMCPDDGNKAFVVRKPLVGKTAEVKAIIPKIVDQKIREIVEAAVAAMEAKGVTAVMPGDIRMPSGVPINKVRTYGKVTDPNELRLHSMPSNKRYKLPYYVDTGTGANFRMAVFEQDGVRSVEPDNALKWAQNRHKEDYRPYDKMPGFIGYIYPGSMALACEAGRADLATLPKEELAKRLYKLVKYETNTKRVTFLRHSEARASVELDKALIAAGKNKAGSSRIDLVHPFERLLVSPGVYLQQMMFEGIDFSMRIDGSIEFKRKDR
ncbi:MAG: type II CRISPR RNA-guided endonuclease Cas9 [Kiritimatiellia bacterium]